ncbi:hypothetical protein JB92DRAFT_3125598 [Gautieria morchelliformis]|nr:hypothetical protein JB92DRAFT_3125598 [Gautieria morchelliformis]
MANAVYLTSTSPALLASIHYLPLLANTALITASLDYLYAHLSDPPMVKVFLLHPSMPSTLKLLVTLLLKEQQENTSHPLSLWQSDKSTEELDRIAGIAEPERSYEWMRSPFVASDAEEMTQVDFWGLYRDTFTQRQDTHQLLTEADVIKNVSHVFPTAQAMVLPGQQARFVIRGITRKMVDVTEERFKCQWKRSSCSSPNFQSPDELWMHVVEHLNTLGDPEAPVCEWSNCQFHTSSLKVLQTHVSTHIPSPEPPSRHPSQLENITLPMTPYPHPSPNPAARAQPSPPNPQVTYPSPSADPPSTPLTALLIVRVVFRASFADTDAAPRADDDYFGFLR